jgi:hypothetical protein
MPKSFTRSLKVIINAKILHKITESYNKCQNPSQVH